MHPVIFQVGEWRLYSYGTLIALAGALATFFWRSRWKQMGLRKADDVWLLSNVLIISGFGGGRLMYLFEYVGPSNPAFWSALVDPNKGFSVMGGFASVALGVYLYCRYLKIDFLPVFDYVCQGAPFGHALGRLGCFAAGCCYGRPTDSAWGVRFTDPISMVPGELLGVPLHPSQLYEAFGDALITVGLYWFVLRRRERGELRPGVLTAAFFSSYGVLRFFTEFFRADTLPTPFFGLTVAQALSVALAVVAGGLVWRISCARS